MEKQNSHYFYVLECRDESFYAGYTNNLEKRIQTHNAGKGAKYTKARGPVKCIYFETFETKQQAMSAEYAFKQLPRIKKIEYMRRATDEITEK